MRRCKSEGFILQFGAPCRFPIFYFPPQSTSAAWIALSHNHLHLYTNQNLVILITIIMGDAQRDFIRPTESRQTSPGSVDQPTAISYELA